MKRSQEKAIHAKKSVNYNFHSRDKTFDKCARCGKKKFVGNGQGHSQVCVDCFHKFENEKHEHERKSYPKRTKRPFVVSK